MMQHSVTFEARWTKVPLDASFAHDLDALATASNGAQLLYLCNPNNPTGTMIDGEELRTFCGSISKDTMVFVDEAYIEFTNGGITSSVAELVASTSNLIVARTFSKIYGLAGLRVGYAYAHPEIIKQLKRYHIGFEINMPITSLYAALTAADDRAFLEHCKAQNNQAKEKLYQTFDEWGVSYVRSQTNFIYFKTEKFVPNIVKTLEKHRIMIRDYDDQPGFARVSIGTTEQMQHFSDTLKQFAT
jgi:histidinol-phosphate aminotransferase